jgi:hypothetical protein
MSILRCKVVALSQTLCFVLPAKPCLRAFPLVFLAAQPWTGEDVVPMHIFGDSHCVNIDTGHQILAGIA